METNTMNTEKETKNNSFLDPNSILRQLSIQLNSVAADFGCASGYFSIPFAQAIGNEGKMLALDVLPSALEAVESKAKSLGLSNVITKRVNLENENGSGLDSDSLDWVIVKDMLFQNKNKEQVLSEVARVLKKEGRALIIEWGEVMTEIGPEADLRIKKDELKGMMEKNGLFVEKEVDAGDFHYGFVAKK